MPIIVRHLTVLSLEIVLRFEEKQIPMLKNKRYLQKGLDTFWVIHNFVRVHFTLKN